MDISQYRSLAEAYNQCVTGSLNESYAHNYDNSYDEFDAVYEFYINNGVSHDEAIETMARLDERETAEILERVNFTKQSSARKSLGRGSSIKDGSKPSGYESKREFRDQEMRNAKDKKNKVIVMPKMDEEFLMDLTIDLVAECRQYGLDFSDMSWDECFECVAEALAQPHHILEYRRQDQEGVDRDDESERRQSNKDRASKGQYISKTQNAVQRAKQQIEKQQRKQKQPSTAGKYLMKQAAKRAKSAKEKWQERNPYRGYDSDD